MNLDQIVRKLVGPIEPEGDSSIDEKRFENLQSLIAVTDSLLRDIRDAAVNRESNEYSVKKIGVFANNYLRGIVEEYGERS